MQITDRSYVIRAGQVLCYGTPDEVLQNKEARKYYFGEDMDLGLRGQHTVENVEAENRLASIRGRLTGRYQTPGDTSREGAA